MSLPSLSTTLRGAAALRRALAAAIFLIGLGFGATGCCHLQSAPDTSGEPQPSVSSRGFAERLERDLDAPITAGNRIVELKNGDEIFPAMLAAIAGAETSVTFENFVWRSGRLSDAFVEALSERARAGVPVLCLTDGLAGTQLQKADIQTMKSAGVQFFKYHPLSILSVFSVNHRTHRKLLVVDGRIGFIGGLSLADEWLGDAERPPLWRDSHYRVEGPVVRQIQETFALNWHEATGRALEGAAFFPELAPAGAMPAQCFPAGPNEGPENAHLNFLQAIEAARERIRIAHSYFLPDRLLTEALLRALARGVEIEIITPGIINANLVRRASRSRWGPLLEAGARFYEYEAALYHCKILVVDDSWVSVGTINFDNRSFHINDEANLNVYDAEFAARQVATLEEDKRKSRVMTLTAYRKRPWWVKVLEWSAARFAPLL